MNKNILLTILGLVLVLAPMKIIEFIEYGTISFNHWEHGFLTIITILSGIGLAFGNYKKTKKGFTIFDIIFLLILIVSSFSIVYFI
ncbi:hypothetical protein [Arcobacter sp. F2176]|uniref:hypothetical protein n=1 Tax=Arcobacter sp. F2176 TaxID=2044511 RepID=UPI00100ADDC7|nr:hypothetical protein [Arcobacter sp. F2176]RXJ82149.1 hypothetical protein CRU95_04490 [Arcobacter sp. F2176]